MLVQREGEKNGTSTYVKTELRLSSFLCTVWLVAVVLN